MHKVLSYLCDPADAQRGWNHRAREKEGEEDR